MAVHAIKEKALPGWAGELRRRYLDGSATQFLLHGNVKDLCAHGDRFVPLREFLHRALLRVKDLVVFYDLSTGITFAEPDMKRKFLSGVNAARSARGLEPVGPALPKDPAEALALLDLVLGFDKVSAAVVLDYAETLCPAGEMSQLGRDERASLVTLQRWATDPQVLGSDHIILLVSEARSDLHPRIVRSPSIRSIEVPLPDLAERKRFLSHALADDPAKLEMPLDRFAEATSGLTRVQLDGIVREASRAGEPIGFDRVSARKRETIEDECAGLLEFVGSRGDDELPPPGPIPPGGGGRLSNVGGLDAVVALLRRIARDVRAGAAARVPMGILVAGPMGTGKSFLVEAFAAESGLTAVKLKGFRDRWVGSTEANLEKILSIVEAMGDVLVIVDEADRALAGSAGESDGGTHARVLARLKEFMGDTRHRGRIVFVVMTNRPDQLDVDLKRPGRLDVKIPLFVPATDAEREAIVRALARKNGILFAQDGLVRHLAAATGGDTGAEIEAVLRVARDLADDAGRKTLEKADLDAAVADFIPTRDQFSLRYMEAVAAFECSSRRLLPERFATLGADALSRQIQELRVLARL